MKFPLMQHAALLLLAMLLLPGCAHLVAPMSSTPVDQYHGTRTWGRAVEDQAIEFKAVVNSKRSNLAHERERIVAVSWNGQLLLAGQVPSDAERAKAEGIAKAVRNVAQVHNELQVTRKISPLARASDAWITMRVKLRLLLRPEVEGRRVKVVTENGVVYLMGLLTREEAEAAVKAAQASFGVQKIVKIFEYIAPENAAH